MTVPKRAPAPSRRRKGREWRAHTFLGDWTEIQTDHKPCSKLNQREDRYTCFLVREVLPKFKGLARRDQPRPAKGKK